MSASVYQLRQEGFKVKVFHVRNVDEEGNITPCGGQTTIELTTPNGETYTQTAKCNMLDHYNKKRGVQIALGRILKSINYANR